jgi:hypothetical protein
VTRIRTTILLAGSLLLGCSDPVPDVPLPDLAGAEAEIVAAVDQARAAVLAEPQNDERWGALADRYMAHGWRREAAACYD